MNSLRDAETIVADMERRLRVRWNLNIDVNQIMQSLEAKELSHAELYNAIVVNLLGTSSEQRWCDKMVLSWSHTAAFLGMYPGGKIVHVIRDPRAVVASFKNITFQEWPAHMDTVFNCKDSMVSALANIEKFGEERVHVVKLEDLISAQAKTTKKLCAFLALDYEPEMLEWQQYRGLSGEPWKLNTAIGSEAGDSDEKWRDHLDDWEVFLCELVCGREMDSLAYPAVGAIPSKSGWDKLYEVLQDTEISRYFVNWLTTRQGVQRYRTDPVEYEWGKVREFEANAGQG